MKDLVEKQNFQKKEQEKFQKQVDEAAAKKKKIEEIRDTKRDEAATKVAEQEKKKAYQNALDEQKNS